MNGFKVAKEKKYIINARLKVMKIINLMGVLFFTTLSFSQNKAIVPKSGTIAFVKKDTITDRKLYLESNADFKPKFLKAFKEKIYFERLSDGKSTDTIQLNKKIKELSNLYDYVLNEKENGIVKYHCNYVKGKILKFIEIDGQKEKEQIINLKNNAITNANDEYVDYYALQTQIINLKEFRNETKVINGFKCFKVKYQYKDDSDPEFEMLSTSTRELWVTESIKSLYHPVINDYQILEKYYPLLIIQYSDDIKGFQTEYKLEKLTFK